MLAEAQIKTTKLNLWYFLITLETAEPENQETAAYHSGR